MDDERKWWTFTMSDKRNRHTCDHRRMQALTSLLLLVLCLPGIYSEGGLSYKIREELPAGTFIGDILSDAKILDSVAPDERGQIRLQLLSQAGRGPPALFNVSEVSGKLYTAQRLDAESLCDVAITCERTIDVAVQKDKDLLKVLKVEILIEDFNDHVPLFAKKEIEVQFLDGDTNKRKSIAKATDRDVGVNNSHISYRLEKEERDDPFRLDVTTRPDGSSDLYLYLDGKLDRETKPEYKVRILAEDNGKPSKKSSLDVKITVADVNDNAPVFEKPKYNVTTENEVNRSKAIVYVKANDADSGKNGEVSYKFSSRTSSVAKRLFELDKNTGAIYLSQKISVEDPTKYTLFVEAVDGAERPLSAQVVVDVQIIHSQNNPPKISINFVSHTAKITEGANSGSFVAYVQVKDPDIGENGKVGCTLTHEFFQLRSLGEDEYKVVIKKPVDRETNEHFNVTITCHDQGSPPLRSESNFRVEVDDINDEYPQFERPVYDVTFEENSIIGIKVEAVSARDKDIGQNGEVRYFFDRDALPYFIVDPQTGIIRTVTVFDRESTSKKEFKIYAKDLGKPSHTSSATMRVNVLDVNDEAPVFTQDLFHFKTYENQLPKFPVGFINATDRDLGDGGKLSYSLITEENQVLPFWISDDGFLSVGQLLDHEYQNSYKFKVFVMDNGKPPLNNTVNVLVDVLDENDNRPYFLFPSVNNFSMAIYYYPDGEKEITVLQATDRDSGENAQLNYEIVSGNENGLFAVDALDGSLSFAREANRDDNGLYMLQLMVKDRGKPPLSTSANFSLSLVVSNETSNKLGDRFAPSNGGVGQNLLIVIALIAVTGSVGLVILITICVIRWNDRRQTTSSRLTSSSSSASSGGHQNSSKCLPTPQISTALELDPSLQNDNTLKGNSTFRTSQRNQDHNIYNPYHGKQVEIFQPSAATVNQGQKFTQDGKVSELGFLSTYDCRSESSGDSSNNDSGRGWSECDAGHVNDHPESSRPISTSQYLLYRPRPDDTQQSIKQQQQRTHLSNVETNPYVRSVFRPKLQDSASKSTMLYNKLLLQGSSPTMTNPSAISRDEHPSYSRSNSPSPASFQVSQQQRRPPVPQTQLQHHHQLQYPYSGRGFDHQLPHLGTRHHYNSHSPECDDNSNNTFDGLPMQQQQQQQQQQAPFYATAHHPTRSLWPLGTAASATNRCPLLEPSGYSGYSGTPGCPSLRQMAPDASADHYRTLLPNPSRTTPTNGGLDPDVGVDNPKYSTNYGKSSPVDHTYEEPNSHFGLKDVIV